jgi:hypothetical protein
MNITVDLLLGFPIDILYLNLACIATAAVNNWLAVKATLHRVVKIYRRTLPQGEE